MKKVHLVIEGDKILHFVGKHALEEAGFVKADKVVTEEEFNSNGCYAHLADGKIIIGLTEEQKKRRERDEIDAQLQMLDQKYLPPRVLAGIGKNDIYANGQFEQHETEAIPLRERRKEIMNFLGE